MKFSLTILLFILLLKSAFSIAVIQSGVIGLGPDEAQYWTWSQQLDWGYYSKPPGIAWQIFFGTLFFGNTELGVRFTALLISFLLSIAVYFLARTSRLTEPASFWAGVAIALSPLGFMSSLLATTDGGLVLFWTIACIFIAKALSEEKPPNYYLLGLIILCGALFKWPIYILWIFIFIVIALIPALRSVHVIGGMAVSLLGLFPSIIWNFSHDWATFKHVFSTMIGGHAKELGATPLLKGNFFEFLGAQASLLSPILFVLLIMSLVHLLRNINTIGKAVVFCGGVTLLLLGVYSSFSFFLKMQGNWCVFAYPTGAVLLSWYCCERVAWGRLWITAGIAVSIILSVITIGIPFAQAKDVGNIPYKISPFRHNVGWNRLADDLKKVGFNPQDDFLFGDKYQMASILSFYSANQNRAYFFNLRGARKNQFSYWPGMPEDQTGKTGFFVIAENDPHLSFVLKNEAHFYQESLEKYFDKVEYLGVWPLFYANDKMVKGALIYKCFNYNGKEPVESSLF